MSKKYLYQNGLMEISNPVNTSVSPELRNQYFANQVLPKKDKKKITITNKLISMEENFFDNKNEYYKNSLNLLQKDLTTTHNETNETLLESMRISQERRDYELTRLLYWENYQISRVEKEAREDVEKINEEYDNFIKIIKDKLYEKLVRKIKLLKEDKVLKDLANLNHYSIDIDLMNNNENKTTNLHRRGNETFNSPQKLASITDSGAISSANNNGGITSDTNNNLTVSINGRRSARRTRNIMEAAYNTDSNLSGNDSSMPGGGNVSSSGKRRRVQTARAAAAASLSHNTRSYSSASNDEANFFSDNNSLSEILFGKNFSANGRNVNASGYTTTSGTGNNGNGGKPSTRAKSKQFTGVQGLKLEEINDDLTIFETCLEKLDPNDSIIFANNDIIINSSNGNKKNGRN